MILPIKMEIKSIDQKLNLIENELISLKLILMKIAQKKKQQLLQLEGSLEGIKVTEEDMAEAKRSLFKYN